MYYICYFLHIPIKVHSHIPSVHVQEPTFMIPTVVANATRKQTGSTLAALAISADMNPSGLSMINLWIIYGLHQDTLWIWLIYPLVMTNIAIEHCKIIVESSIQQM